jgi:hypothetical protein
LSHEHRASAFPSTAASHYIIMQGPNDEASVPKTYVFDSRILGVTMRRKIGIRTYPWPTEDLPAAKRPRLQAPTSSATAVVGVTTDPPEDTPTVLVTPAASLPSAGTSRAPRRNWKGEEDAKLTEAVKKHGKHWVEVATMVPGRTSEQCLSRWTKTVDPANWGKGKWTPAEDAKLTEAVKKNGKTWVKVAVMVPGRTSEQCCGRWVKTVDPANWRKGKWTPAEDAKLTEAVKKNGKKWVKVAVMVPGRTSDQCRERWVKQLDPANGKKGKLRRVWTPEEDVKLVGAVEKHGKHWVPVAAMVPGRSNILCHHRWVKYLDPDRASNTVEEGYIGNDEALV